MKNILVTEYKQSVQIDFGRRASLILEPYEAEALGVFLGAYLAGATDKLAGETYGTDCYIGVCPSDYADEYVTVHVSSAYFDISMNEAAVLRDELGKVKAKGA
jgi:hypothetical protein